LWHDNMRVKWIYCIAISIRIYSLDLQNEKLDVFCMETRIRDESRNKTHVCVVFHLIKTLFYKKMYHYLYVIEEINRKFISQFVLINFLDLLWKNFEKVVCARSKTEKRSRWMKDTGIGTRCYLSRPLKTNSSILYALSYDLILFSHSVVYISSIYCFFPFLFNDGLSYSRF